MEQELLILPEHLSSLFSEVSITRYFVVCACFVCRSWFVLYLLLIVLSVFLRLTNSDYPLGIFKLFSQMITWYAPFVIITNGSFPHWWLITGFVTREKRWVPLAEQKLLILPQHLSSSLFSGVRVAQSSTSTKLRPPWISWRLCQTLYMTIEKVKTIYKSHRLILNRRDGSFERLNWATHNYGLRRGVHAPWCLGFDCFCNLYFSA